MGSVSSDEHESERCGSYSLSADVSESESYSSFSCRRFDGEGASASLTSSPRPTVASSFCLQAPVLLPVIGGKDMMIWDVKPEKRETDLSEVEMMKERFAKLLLGEDMSGGGKGVCTALAISNAITNLSATVFGELWRLEPLAPLKKSMWRREIGWLLCVSDSIVELVPSIQQFPGGGTYEVMATRPRLDLYMNLPALKKLDAMLISMLDGFGDTEFWYVDRGIIVADGGDCDVYPSSISGGRPSIRQEEKWWLPCPKVPSNGLSKDARKRLQQCRDCTNQILKAAMAINSSVLAEMEIPSVYLETLPKDVGQSILESYSRVMESLAFNIMARIDDVIYVDDATKCAAAESMSLFNRNGLGGLPIQKRMSPSPFSIQHSPFASPFATPTFCASTPVAGSPGRTPSSLNKISTKEASDQKFEKPCAAEFEKVWSYTGNLSARRVSGDAPERD
ncbi:hypothetical protein GH714_003646 [Hevea brasiliensis]|uniref:PRONE domain-containing protein n=1 Tax=Hevea brasiliensis TaxID=3981 RepID=A0A6A6L881_HEVBR|nr:hypothetical protein GH714_003646 [Hevea brasiliensis]